MSPLYRMFVCSRHSLSPDWRGVVHCALNTAACTKTFFFPAQSMEMIEQIIMVMISMLVGQEGVNLFIVFYPWLFWQLIHIVVNVRCMWWKWWGIWCLVLSAGISASKSSIQRFVIMEKAPTRAFSWLKAATTAFTFKTLLRHYAKRALSPQ